MEIEASLANAAVLTAGSQPAIQASRTTMTTVIMGNDRICVNTNVDK